MKAATKITFPPEWLDDERMFFLLAPFPPTAKPTTSDPKVAFWRSLILSSSHELQELIFSEASLVERFRWRGSAPKCLSAVIRCMESSGEARKVSSYSDTGWGKWTAGLVSRPISWAWQWYWGSGSRDGSFAASEEQYVLVKVVKVMEDH